MSKQLARIGVPGPAVDVLDGGDVDFRTGRLLTVAELQQALRLAVTGGRESGRTRRSDQTHAPATATVAASVRAGGPAASGGARVAAEPPAPGSQQIESAAPAWRPSKEREEHQEQPPPPGITAREVGDDLLTGRPDGLDREVARAGAGWSGGAGEWGASPVPLPGVSGGEQHRVPVDGAPSVGGEDGGLLLPEVPRFAVAELLRSRGREQDLRAQAVLAGRWTGRRRVGIGAVSGGAGCSAIAELLAGAGAAAGCQVLGAAADEPPWWPEPTAPPVAADGAVSWSLGMCELPAGPAGLATAAAGVELLVLVCPGRPGELERAAGVLADLESRAGVACGQRAVVAVRGDRRGLPRAARRVLPVLAGVAAGVVLLPWLSQPSGRHRPVSGLPPAAARVGRVLLAAVAAAPPLTGDPVGEETVADQGVQG